MKINELVAVDWSHKRESGESVCTISVGDDKFVSKSKVHRGDQFSYSEGRRRSLTRAIACAKSFNALDRSKSAEIWGVLLKRVNLISHKK